MKTEKAVVLLSGGLDSTVSLAVAREKFSIELAVFFDYGQKAFKKEMESVICICDYYKIPFRKIRLEWLEEVCSSALVNTDENLPEYTLEGLDSDIAVLHKSARAVWVPNRNGVMLNIAASIAEAISCNTIIFGANSEEAKTFPDNSADYVNALNKALSFSTANSVKVFVPLVDKDKSEIVTIALKYKAPLDLVWSCYLSKEKLCGKCESCVRFKNALFNNNLQDTWQRLSSL